MNNRQVTISATVIRMSLPNDFGEGWDYNNVKLYSASNSYSQGYERTDNANFAHEALERVKGINSTRLYPGMCCFIEFGIKNLEDINAMHKKVQAVVDAFPVQKQNQITVRGSNYPDSIVNVLSKDFSAEVISDMPLMLYMAKHVPMAETHPMLDGRSAKEVIREFEAAPVAKAESAKLLRKKASSMPVL